MLPIDDGGKECSVELPVSENFAQKSQQSTFNDGNEEAQPAPCDSMNFTNQGAEKPLLDADAKGRTPELAIEVKRFRTMSDSDQGTKNYVEGLNLRVPRGIIYGLIMDRDPYRLLEFVAGVGPHLPRWIQVLGRVPGTPGASVPGPGVGYVSHQFPLYGEHTAGEILHFVGKLYGMTEALIKQRIETLSKFVQLPPETRPLKRLSDTESHIVSIAAAVIHSPPVLILEQTSLFLSTLTRWRIWNLLRMLSRDEGVTVLIATSYIEDLQQADLVGFMKDCRILVQECPRQLLARLEFHTLQEVCLQLYATLGTDEEEKDHRSRADNEGIVEETCANALGRDAKASGPLPLWKHLLFGTADPGSAPNSYKEFMKRSAEAMNFLSQIFMLSKLFPRKIARNRLERVFARILSESSIVFPAIYLLLTLPEGPATPPEDINSVEGELGAVEYFTSGFIFSYIFLISMLRTVLDRSYRDYTADRSFIAGIKLNQVAASSILAQFRTMLIPMVLIWCVFVPWLINRGSPSLSLFNPGSLTLVTILCLLQALQGVALGVVLSVRWFPPKMTFMGVFCYGAGNIFMTQSLYPIAFSCRVLPQAFPVEAFRGIIYQGWGIGSYEVWIALSCSIAWSALLLCSAIRVLAVSIQVRPTA